MTSTMLLCNFCTNPFGNEQKARELLSVIENRSVSDVEFERGLFCFQIASFFLARLAVATHIEDSSLRKILLDQLHDQAREFFARSNSRIEFSDFVTSPAELDEPTPSVQQRLDDADGMPVDAPWRGSTKLELFDLVSSRRLREYEHAMGQPGSSHKFYFVANQVLFHYDQKRYHPLAVLMIADVLLANYNSVSKMIDSGLHAINTPQTEDVFQYLPLSASMPDLTRKRPSKIYLAGRYVLPLVENVGPIGGASTIRFRYVLAVCEKWRNLPLCLVTLEDSFSVSNVLCVFEQDGSHSNYGCLRDHNLLHEFIHKGMRLISDRFDIGESKEWVARPQWQVWRRRLRTPMLEDSSPEDMTARISAVDDAGHRAEVSTERPRPGWRRESWPLSVARN
jgi:hypothetical protein